MAIARTATLRFSTLGVASVGTVLATGIVNTFELAGTVPALFGTGYGRLLLVKIALFLAMLAIAGSTACNSHRSSSPAAPRPVRRCGSCARTRSIEAVIGAVILFIVAVLGTLPPGREEVSVSFVAHQGPTIPLTSS